MCTQSFFYRATFLIILLTCFISGCNDSTSSTVEDTPIVRPAKLIEVGQANTEYFLNYPAVIKAQQSAELAFEVSGVLNELFVVQAQKVNKGDALAKLDQRDLLVKLKSVQAQFDIAETEYQRAVRLMKEDAISRSELEQRKSKRDVNKAQLQTANKALQDSILIAPYSGVVSKIYINDRQTIQAGELAVSIIGQLDQSGFEATINLPSSIIAKSGKREKPAAGSYIVLDAAPELHIPAVFKEASLEADTASQTYEITYTFVSPKDLIILPGMNAVVWFREPGQSSASKLTIPLTAIATDGSQKYVWLVDQNSMLVSRKNITLEDGVGNELEVIGGLKSGDTIVAAGVSHLSEGVQVRPWSK